jgi:hypothetical protein
MSYPRPLPHRCSSHDRQTLASHRPPWIVNEDSSVQVRELDRVICAVTGQLVDRERPPCDVDLSRSRTDRTEVSSRSSLSGANVSVR